MPYARFNFISEENMMFRAGYPKFNVHRNFHVELFDQLSSNEGMLSINNSEIESVDVVGFFGELVLPTYNP